MRQQFAVRWMLVVAAAETFGFAVPAAVGGTLTVANAPTGLVYPAMIAAGAAEGALLGLGQWVGFGSRILDPRRWIAATSFGAALAWSLGMLPSTLGGLDFAAQGTVVFVALGGLALLASIPVAQWIVLRHVVPSSVWWIPLTMGAWAVAIMWTLAPSPFIDERAPAGTILAVYIVAGLLMAATVAALTAPGAHRLSQAMRRHNAGATSAAGA